MAELPPDLRAAFADPSADVLIAIDFDGTLAPIVANPEDAQALVGAEAVLTSLAATPAEVAVISGRPLAFLREHLPADMTLVGLYGLQMRRDGEIIEHPNSGVWRETIVDVASGALHNGPAAMRVEPKELSLTLHYREHPEIESEVLEYARKAGADAGLQVRLARMSVELHPPIGEDKGTALTRLAEDHDGPVMFVGDDLGDLPAFDALDTLGATGRPVARVAAASDESPPELAERADVVVDGPAGVLELLAGLRS